ncbi:hypothetical protein ACI01nite_26250 [Acetobacter cibinongensis]|uniref:Uncharacterized protein n=2 Tax=Acetobacter TaxID=434 RepID=A0A4Y3TN17_9PROT|nr:hypothetical protein AD949_03605 [Acetobacter orleanensis]GAN60135.1 hypothetical protein Abci_009_040 [Acetobacter cibinongensis]GAN69946.1 hypothetical protein Abol_293_002 [Acetobacter orleanensis JCM 7639]GBQ11764.1 hypothetical protein AA0482_0038 [Acetobacter cibinongensis NRIC 0482]GBR29245.1 hypothetical protein AA0473_1976 [Acetobacter orleanensis NRIC 0473]
MSSRQSMQKQVSVQMYDTQASHHSTQTLKLLVKILAHHAALAHVTATRPPCVASKKPSSTAKA